MFYTQSSASTVSPTLLTSPFAYLTKCIQHAPGGVRAFLLRPLILLLVAGLGLLAVPTVQAQMVASTRLDAFENTTIEGKQVPFVIEEMQVGYIRHLIDYLLLHGRYNVESGKTKLAGAQLQWAASLMDLNAGLTKSPEQKSVRKAAAMIDELAQAIASGETPSDAHARLFKAHHAMATYHQRRAMKLLDATTPTSEAKGALVRQNAIFQEKAGVALSAALTHYDRATTLLADMKEMPVAQTHKDDVKMTYTFVEALRVAGGQVDTEKAKASTKTLGQAIAALSVK